jgi:hypothetical protein
MELDRVRSNTGLAMLEVEEGDPGDTGAEGHPQLEDRETE